jgi:hypothetical protein
MCPHPIRPNSTTLMITLSAAAELSAESAARKAAEERVMRLYLALVSGIEIITMFFRNSSRIPSWSPTRRGRRSRDSTYKLVTSNEHHAPAALTCVLLDLTGRLAQNRSIFSDLDLRAGGWYVRLDCNIHKKQEIRHTALLAHSLTHSA